MAKPLLIHVGFHKTGTTWLQYRLFQAEFGYRQLMTAEEIDKCFVKPNYFEFDASSIKKRLDELRQEETGAKVDVISSEILCGQPFYGGRETDQFAQRLKSVVGDALILIGIREQLSAIRSTYMQYVSRCGTMTPEEFFDGESDLGYHGFSASHFKYHEIVKLYQDLFGLDNVHVITQEKLGSDRKGIIESIANFTSNDTVPMKDEKSAKRVGVSYPEYVSQLQRRVNHFRSGPVHRAPVLDLGGFSFGAYKLVGRVARQKPFAKLFKGYKPVTSVVERRFKGQFADSNKELKRMLGDGIELPGYEGFNS